MLVIGLKATAQTVVCEENTAVKMGSGELPVFATPAMIALMEKASSQCVANSLEQGQGTVGTLINVKHLAASPITSNITAESELVQIDGKRLVFIVKAFDDSGLIGEGTHERFIINNEKFMAKTQGKIKTQ